jgi:hypothetical protein
MKNNQEKRIRRWVLTLNNPTLSKEQYLDHIQKQEVIYAIVAQEYGDDKKTKHLQCYIEYKNPATFSQMKERFPLAHIEQAIAHGSRNRTYCIKQNDFCEFGIVADPKMSVDEIAYDVVSYLKQGFDLLKIIELCPQYTQYIIRNWRALSDIKTEITLKRDFS